MKEATKVSLLVNDGTSIKPWRTSGLPILITERPPSLYCSIHPINHMHNTCIKNTQMKRENLKFQKVFELFEDPQTRQLQVVFKGIRKISKETYVAKDQDQIESRMSTN
jgi:hypothetical protein